MTQAALWPEEPDAGHAERLALSILRTQVEDEYGGRSVLFEQFLTFHRQNPRVLALLLRFADELIAAGRLRFGIAALWERMRWFVAIETQSDMVRMHRLHRQFGMADRTPSPALLKLNNSYRSFYARLLILLRPALATVLQTRRLGPGREGQVV